MGTRFHTNFADELHSLGFMPAHADPNVWARDAGGCHKCVVVHVDDALTALKDPDMFHKEQQSNPGIAS